MEMIKVCLNDLMETGLLLCALLYASAVQAAPLFNHNALKQGAIQETCYREPCSIAKVIGFKQLAKTSKSSMLELTLLGGERQYKKKNVRWNKNPHKVYITCSQDNPTMTLDGQVTILPLNPSMSVPGVLTSDTELYLWACHNFKGSDTVAARKFGYNVHE